MPYRIRTTSGGAKAVVLPTAYDDLAQAVGIAKRLHEIEHVELGARFSDAVEVLDEDDKIVWRRSTASDYLGLGPETY